MDHLNGVVCVGTLSQSYTHPMHEPIIDNRSFMIVGQAPTFETARTTAVLPGREHRDGGRGEEWAV